MADNRIVGNEGNGKGSAVAFVTSVFEPLRRTGMAPLTADTMLVQATSNIPDSRARRASVPWEKEIESLWCEYNELPPDTHLRLYFCSPGPLECT
jgi:hypothetical protein